MKIGQFYYTRTDGDTSGWKYVKISEEISKEWMDKFEAIHTHTPSKEEKYSFDVRGHFFYLSKVVELDLDSLGRERSFMHGYVFSGMDSEYLFNNYARLLNICSFANSEEATINEINDLPIEEYKPSQIASQINLLNLMKGVYEAILQGKILYIYTDCREREEFTKSVLYVIYKHLPLHLRRHISFSSTKSGSARNINIVNNPDDLLGMVYDFNTGEISGCENKYVDFVKTMLENPQEVLGEIEKFIEGTNETAMLQPDKYVLAFSYIAMKNANQGNVNDSNVVGELDTIIRNAKYKESAGAMYAALLINQIVDNKIETNSKTQSEILDLYDKTKNVELKQSIAQFMIYIYGIGCTEKDFEKFSELQYRDKTLYTGISIAMITGKAEEFIQRFTTSALNDKNVAEFIAYECGEACAAIIGCKMAEKIVAEKAVRFFDNVINGALHKNVLSKLIQLNPDDDILWNYIETIFSSAENVNRFRDLENGVVTFMARFLVKECQENSPKISTMMQRIYRNDSTFYEELEAELSRNSKFEIIDEFYASTILGQATTVEQVMEIRSHLAALSSRTVQFDRGVMPKCTSLLKRECTEVDKTKLAVEQIKALASHMAADGEYYADSLREYFWSQFKVTAWDLDKDYSDLYHSQSQKSSIISDLQNAIDILRNRKPENPSTITRVLIHLAGTKDSTIPLADRDCIIKKMKEEFITPELRRRGGYSRYSGEEKYRKKKASRRNENSARPQNNPYGVYESYGTYDEFNMNMDLYLLMHYSNVERALDEDMYIPEAALERYIRDCSRDDNAKHMLSKSEVIVQLYKVIYLKNGRNVSNTTLQRISKYVERTSKSTQKVVKKELRKLTEVKDFTWISIVSLLSMFSYLNAYLLVLGFPILSWILCGVLVLLGLAILFLDAYIDACEHGSLLVMIGQLVSGCSLYVVMLVTLTVLSKLL